MTDTTPKCCERQGLVYPDGARRCWKHATDADGALVAALDARAPARGISTGTTNGGWPYGPNIDVASRAEMLDWAEAHDLRLSKGRCLHWLRNGRCSARMGDGSHSPRGWMDHVTGWNRGGKPAVLVSHPYGLSSDGIRELAAITEDPLLRVSIDGTGWYRYQTTFITVWRVDHDSTEG